jgi:hypothetical protein
MGETKIYYLFGIEGKKLLLVFNTPRNCYQFRVVRATGEVMGDEKTYYTPVAALTEGRRWLGVSGFIKH